MCSYLLSHRSCSDVSPAWLCCSSRREDRQKQVLEDCGGMRVSFMGRGVGKYLFEVVHSQGELLQSEQYELQQRGVSGGL